MFSEGRERVHWEQMNNGLTVLHLLYVNFQRLGSNFLNPVKYLRWKSLNWNFDWVLNTP